MEEKNEIREPDQIILRYLEGEASEEEKAYLYHWIKLSEENRAHFAEVQELWLSAEAALSSEDETLKALKRFRFKIKDYESHTINISRKVFYYLSQFAALLVIVLSLYYWFFIREPETEHFACVEMSTGNKGCITLPDSTIVWLNSGSKLVYPNRFSKKERRVRLEGQAYFEVSHRENRSFIVETNDMDIEVQGTSFVVKNYIQDEYIETALVSGCVKVYFPDSSIKSVWLKPAERVIYSRKTKETEIKKSSDVSLYRIWAQDKLLLDNCELDGVIEKLGAWYGVQTVYEKTFSEPVYVTLTVRGESLNEIFETLKAIAPIDYHINGNTVYIQCR